MAKHDVTFRRPEYIAALGRWQLVDDCCAGQEAVKDKTTDYLPKPNPLDKSKEADQRYKDYLERAVFYNVTGRTLQGLIGMVFRKWPVANLPDGLKYAETDIDGSGVSIYQQSQEVLEGVLKKGRYGLLVDYPQTEGNVSKADLAQNQIRASIQAYDAGCIINWRIEKVGGVHKLVLLVLQESREVVTEDGFGVEAETQYRVLRLVGGVYTQEVWREQESGTWAIAEGPYAPTDGSGRPWSEIPFTIVGSQNNDTSIDPGPLYDLAELNIAHYRNSAEYEDSCFMCGQVQPVFTGVSEHWVNTVWKPMGAQIGSRIAIPMEAEADFKYVQAEPNMLPLEAMRHKEEQMIALGAQLIIKGGQARTATEAESDTAMSTSVLSLIANNVSEAYTKCLQWMAQFEALPDGGSYELNQDFVEQVLDAQTLQAYMQMVQFGTLPESDFWEILRKHGVINPEKDDEEIRGELESQTPALELDDGDE